jgi:hypothetical protein
MDWLGEVAAKTFTAEAQRTQRNQRQDMKSGTVQLDREFRRTIIGKLG